MTNTLGTAYRDIHNASIHEREKFWLDAAAGVDWYTPPTAALDDSEAPFYRWFPGGTLNTSYNALDRHVLAGRGEQPALIHDSAVKGKSVTYTYSKLLREVEKFAGVLSRHGVAKGDRVVIYMPMIPEAVIAMLATARLGAIHSVVFGGFAANELAVRLDDARPTVVVTASGGREPSRVVEYLPLVAKALELTTHHVDTVIVKKRPQVPGTAADYDGLTNTRWFDWKNETKTSEPHAAVPVAASDPLYILYTSGTTGTPKGVVRDNGGHAVALTWSMENIYTMKPGEVMFTGSDVGWVVGHSYIVYAPLLAGATTVLYEGKPVGTPDAGAFWRIVRDHNVKVLFTAPTALRAIRKEDPQAHELAKYRIPSLEHVFLAGERLDPDTYHWATETLGVPVVDHWWQTETGWPICASPRGIEVLPLKAGSPSFPVPGYDLEILDERAEPLPHLAEGNIVIRLPLPPGTLTTLWGNDDRYRAGYLNEFPGYYLTGDSGYIDSDGYVFVMGRTDDVINVAGHRFSTGAMEAVIAGHPAVAESAVVGVNDDIKGQVPAAYVVLKKGVTISDEELSRDLVARMREQIGAVAAFHQVTVIPALPKTRSGKVLRKTMRQIIAGEHYVVPATIDDVEVLAALEETVRRGVVAR
ncbi:propionyl-CoA synthetase [Klugiella xanthotipulae]|uniref:Propionyl-CoA synthetase n=1 Tax=Klugiella xanthotipulae TaxID=244735 RepID=A0A543I4L4_9MICO|nr:AMP-binding protein [Klugiella xanthotipulae]TQM65543.1 propionyl-CoA synthetase [Klugiella xanthotipulae]